MKDLYVLTADKDALAVMKSVLNRHQSLEIRPITYDVESYIWHDAGIVQTGPQWARTKKGQYSKAILMWDYHGSGREMRKPVEPPDKSAEDIQNQLDIVSWKSNSGTAVMVPELEELLWHNEHSICQHYNVDVSKLKVWIKEFAAKQNITINSVKTEKPKELLEYICGQKLRKPIVANDFRKIATKASLKDWKKSKSFNKIVKLLQEWFPPN